MPSESPSIVRPCRRAFRTAALILLIPPFGPAGCHHDDEIPILPHVCSLEGAIDESRDPAENPVWYYNARTNGDRTRRWSDGDVFVRIAYEAVQPGPLQTILDDLNALISPSRLVLLEDGAPADAWQISIEYNGGLPEHRGSTTILTAGDLITRAVIQLNDDGCLDDLVKHELFHATGFFGHTDNGGLMDAVVHNGLVAPIVTETMTGLYGVAPGTTVGP